MKGRTRILIGLVLVALGLGVAALGLLTEESDVRYVEDIVERPGRHDEGTYTLMGVPQPVQVPLAGAEGTVLVANSGWVNETRSVVAWTAGGTTYHSTHVLVAEPAGTETHFRFRNETRIPGTSGLVEEPVETTWTLPGRGFTVEAFNDGDGVSPRVWAVYDGPLKEPMRPKPSQFTGRLLIELPDGTALPEGAMIYWVEEYTAGCSSKFVPPEEDR